MINKTFLICTCLLDIACPYNGKLSKKRLDPLVLASADYHFVPVCPEQLGGLPTPRKPAEVTGGDGFDVFDGNARVLTEDGEDFTHCFVKGAKAVLEIARVTHATGMVTQRRSPSCSCNGIYDGTFSHTLVPGLGVCAALLHQNNLALMEVDRFEEEILNKNE
jgi:uncharacterized protein YbbK (DUF523 family)